MQSRGNIYLQKCEVQVSRESASQERSCDEKNLENEGLGKMREATVGKI